MTIALPANGFEITWECPTCGKWNTTTFTDGPTQCPYICDQWTDRDGFARKGVREYDWNQLLTTDQFNRMNLRLLMHGQEVDIESDRANAIFILAEKLAAVLEVPICQVDNDGVNEILLGEIPADLDITDPEADFNREGFVWIHAGNKGFNVSPAPVPMDMADYRESAHFELGHQAVLCAFSVYADLHPTR